MVVKSKNVVALLREVPAPVRSDRGLSLTSSPSPGSQDLLALETGGHRAHLR